MNFLKLNLFSLFLFSMNVVNGGLEIGYTVILEKGKYKGESVKILAAVSKQELFEMNMHYCTIMFNEKLAKQSPVHYLAEIMTTELPKSLENESYYKVENLFPFTEEETSTHILPEQWLRLSEK